MAVGLAGDRCSLPSCLDGVFCSSGPKDEMLLASVPRRAERFQKVQVVEWWSAVIKDGLSLAQDS